MQSGGKGGCEWYYALFVPLAKYFQLALGKIGITYR
jgi:hypothetical protein